MKGSEKQIKWAKSILEPVQSLIEKMPHELRERHQRSFDAIESAATVIGCRHAIADWCDRCSTWMDTGDFYVSLLTTPYGAPSVIRSVIF